MQFLHSLLPRTPLRLALFSSGLFFLVYLARLIYMLHLQGRGCVAVLDVVSCESVLATGAHIYEWVYMALYYAQAITEIVFVFGVVGSVLWYIIANIYAYRSGAEPKGLSKAIIASGLLLFVFVSLVFSAYKQIADEAASKYDADAIQLIHITNADVDGSILPKAPSASVRDASIAGVDSNNNTIRDDVEIALFEQHKNTQERAAALQYAQALQVMLTKVYSEETMRAALEKRARAKSCIVSESRNRAHVDDLVLNTDTRKKHLENIFVYHMTSYGGADVEDCDYEK